MKTMNRDNNHHNIDSERNRNVDLLITGGTVITQNEGREIISDGLVAVQGGEIVAVGKADQYRDIYSSRKVINASGQFVFPGLINTHNHLFQTFMKGLGEGLPLYRWLNAVTAPSTTVMNERDGYLASMVGLIEAIRSGTTTVLDFMYALPKSYLYPSVANAFIDLQIRGLLGWGLLESGEQHGLAPSMFRPVGESLADLSRFTKNINNELIKMILAPGIVFGVTRKGLEETRQYASDHSMLITTHINETDDDNLASIKDYGIPNIRFLNEIGILGPDFLAVHCVKMTDEDIDIFVQNDVKISHNPVSNMYLGSGIAPVIKMRKAGLKVSIATDGAASNNSQDMLEVVKATGLLQKLSQNDPSAMNANTVLDMATIEGARCIGMENQIGSVEVGKKADLFIFNPIHSRSVPVLDPVASLIFSSGKECVETVIVNGKVVMEHGEIITIKEVDLLKESQEAATALTFRSGTHNLLRKIN